MLTFGSLFAGIGGFDLGFERAGMKCRWQVEIDPFCQKVLAKHWPDVGRWDDVRTFPPPPAEDWRVDVICGGFPCQDISNGNPRGKGLSGPRSGLWSEFKRIICEIRPEYSVVENVPALFDRGFGRVLGDLAEIGLDAEWATLPASWFGACHRRARVFLVAYASGKRLEGLLAGKVPRFDYLSSLAACGGVEAVRERSDLPEPLFYRDRNGLSCFVDRTRAIGNAVVPQIAQWIGERILENHRSHSQD